MLRHDKQSSMAKSSHINKVFVVFFFFDTDAHSKSYKQTSVGESKL